MDHYLKRSKIKLSGDIQENPGPKIKCKTRPLSHLQRNSFVNNQIKLILKHKISYEPSKYLTTLLLIKSNDVESNPGPNHREKCKNCSKNIISINSLKCNNCNKTYHKDCTFIQSSAKDGSFQWICTEPNCNPNYDKGFSNHQFTSTNKFSPLHQNETTIKPNKLSKQTSRNNPNTSNEEPLEKNQKQNKKSKDFTIVQRRLNQKKTNKSKVDFKEDLNPENSVTGSTLNEFNTSIKENNKKLLTELPQICSKDYIGKDICAYCRKYIKENQNAISCDLCFKWTHRTCCKMPIQTYRSHQKDYKLTWYCNICSCEDYKPETSCTWSKLKAEDYPEPSHKVKKKTGELLVLVINGRSIQHKEVEIAMIIEDMNPDIICMVETWLDESTPQVSFLPPEYRIIRKDRTEEFKKKYCKSRGGGTAIIFKSNLNITMRKDLSDTCEDILWAQVRGKNSFMLGVIYRPEYSTILNDNDSESTIENNIRKVTEVTNKVMVTGDLNADVLDKNNKDAKALSTIYKNYGLTQYIKKPTRIDKVSGRPTLIDHVWATEDMNIYKTGTHAGISDHLGAYVKLKSVNEKPEKIKFKTRNFKNYNSVEFARDVREGIQTSMIKQKLENKDINGATDILLKILKENADKHAPMIEVVKKEEKKIPWYTEELKAMIRTKNELIHDSYSHGFRPYRKRIQVISNKITSKKRSLKKEYIINTLDKIGKDTKKLWRLLNVLANRKKISDDIEPDSLTQDQVNEHNKFFATIGSKIQEQLGHPKIRTPRKKLNKIQSFYFKPESTDKIKKLIDNIKIDVAPGKDQLNAKLIKDVKEEIAPIITEIINAGYKNNIFPDCLKEAIIKPIFKKEDQNDISNYRPISLLPILSKVFERAATDQLVKFLEENKILGKHQHAYRKFYSTLTCLVEVTNHIYKLMDQKKHIALLSLDLSKAFDSISHQLLLHKLQAMGLDENSINWIKSYLTSRQQQLKFKNYMSTTTPVEAGVPQGSILGPLLFLCFTNDLAEDFEGLCKMFAYADDTQLIIEAPNQEELEHKIKEALKTAQKWYSENTMKNNIGKTEFLIFNNHNNKKFDIHMQDQGKAITLKPKSHIKTLGIFIDDNLNWSKQVKIVKRKTMNAVRNLHRINHLLPKQLRLNLYNAIVTPLFNYCDIIWNGCNAKERKNLQIVQNFAAKSITGHRKYDSATDSLCQLQLLNLHQRRKLHEVVFVHKALKNQSAQNICEEYQNCISTVNTRNSTTGKLTLPSHNTAKFERSCLHRTIKSWNDAPQDVPKDNIRSHKNQLQKYLIKETYGNQLNPQN